MWLIEVDKHVKVDQNNNLINLLNVNCKIFVNKFYI